MNNHRWQDINNLLDTVNDIDEETRAEIAELGGPVDHVGYSTESIIRDMTGPIVRTDSAGHQHDVVGGRLHGADVVSWQAPDGSTVTAEIPMPIDTADTATLLALEINRRDAVQASIRRSIRNLRRQWDRNPETMPEAEEDQRAAIREAAERGAGEVPALSTSRTVRPGESAQLMPTGRWRERTSTMTSRGRIIRNGNVVAHFTAGPNPSSFRIVTDGSVGKGRKSKAVAEVWDHCTPEEQERLLALRGSISRSRKARNERDAIIATVKERMSKMSM